ncbi:MAG: putative endonuclease [Crocinitomix sp.]|jgi:putative endonuclease
MYYVYILHSEKFSKFYIGQTKDRSKRLKEHNAGQSKSTKAFRPWGIVWFCSKPTRSEAMVLERKLKNLNRERLLDFIEKYSN